MLSTLIIKDLPKPSLNTEPLQIGYATGVSGSEEGRRGWSSVDLGVRQGRTAQSGARHTCTRRCENISCHECNGRLHGMPSWGSPSGDPPRAAKEPQQIILKRAGTRKKRRRNHSNRQESPQNQPRIDADSEQIRPRTSWEPLENPPGACGGQVG